jgi:thiamine-monophosphate kinase
MSAVMADEGKTLGDLGEREVIRRLAKLVPSRDDVALGIGDDAAVVTTGRHGPDLLITTDPLIAGIHFDAAARPQQIGHKAIGRTFSDIAAMGGEPLWTAVNLVAPAATGVAVVEGIYEGLSALADRYDVAVVGGDLAEGPVLEVHVFTVGQVGRGSAVTRAGARPGDVLFVTGELGGSRSGKHLDFEPRIAEGLWLREAEWATAMIDVTDGLATDLRHILEASGVGADIEWASLPVARALQGEADAVPRAMTDGEDFELLFVVHPDRAAALESLWPESFETRCTRIGVITAEKGELFGVHESGARASCGARGFEHFGR